MQDRTGGVAVLACLVHSPLVLNLLTYENGDFQTCGVIL